MLNAQRLLTILGLSLMTLSGQHLLAQDAPASRPTAEVQSAVADKLAKTEASFSNVQSVLDQQSKLLAAQQAQLEQQAEQIKQQTQLLSELQKQLNQLSKQQMAAEMPVENQQEQIQAQETLIGSQSSAIAGLQIELDRLKIAQDKSADQPTTEEIALKERIASLETSVQSIPQDSASLLGMKSFPGSFRVPGTNGAIKFGGFVKVVAVKSFEPIGSQDRFIVGSIPVPSNTDATLQKNTSLTANQSRFNVEFREDSSLGQFRAFIEGDFVSNDDQFRLRNAFGQFRQLLAGQTWSTFYDPLAMPEEIDFEGVSGAPILRQTQIRFFPKIGKNWDLQISAEDPVPSVTEYCDTNCTEQNRLFAPGAANIPDIVMSIQRTWSKRYHIKVAALSRSLRSTSTDPNNAGVTNTDDAKGWGLTASGVLKGDWWGKDDNLKFQATIGKGIGRYTNDTNSVGGLDGVFDENLNLKPLPLLAGFLAYEHWWAPASRSTFAASYVTIKNFNFQPDSAYKRTLRFSGNFLWSPIPRVDLGGELIWGKRTNKNDDAANAVQAQGTAIYRF